MSGFFRCLCLATASVAACCFLTPQAVNSICFTLAGAGKLQSAQDITSSKNVPQLRGTKSSHGDDVQNDSDNVEGWSRWVAAIGASLVVAVGAFVAKAPLANADSRTIGQIPASGLIFKDTINVEAITDPKVQNVTLYQSDFSRSTYDKLAKGDFFSDPGAAGLTCVTSGKVKVSPQTSTSKEGEDVFTESKSLLFKTLKVKRIYDKDANNIVYVVFTERMNNDNDKNGSRFKSQMCAVHVD